MKEEPFANEGPPRSPWWLIMLVAVSLAGVAVITAGTMWQIISNL